MALSRTVALSLTCSFLLVGVSPASPVRATPKPDNTLAVLLQALKARPLGLYDGLRYYRVESPKGPLTVTINCEQQTWRVLQVGEGAGNPGFRNDPFLSAGNIGRSALCQGTPRVMQ